MTFLFYHVNIISSDHSLFSSFIIVQWERIQFSGNFLGDFQAPADATTEPPSPLDLLYEAADDDLNAISFEKSPSTSTQNGIESSNDDGRRPTAPFPSNDGATTTETAKGIHTESQ